MTPAPVAFSAAGAGAASTGQAGTRPKLERAYLQLYQPSRDGSLAQPGPALDRIAFQFNPKELSLEKAATWSRGKGRRSKRSSPPQYTGPQPSKLSLEMFFDASDTHSDSVVRDVERLFGCCVPTEDSHAQKKDSPPWVMFRWGGLTGFLAYVSSVKAKYTLFTSSGLPIRAVCTVTLEELSGEASGQNPTSGGRVPYREHVVVEGESLAAIAYREYSDAALWRKVAQVNGIDDPFRLRPGDRVLLPTVAELTRTVPGAKSQGVVRAAR